MMAAVMFAKAQYYSRQTGNQRSTPRTDMTATIPPARLTARLYSYAEADRVAGVSRGTSKRWIEGYNYRNPGGARRHLAPVTPGRVSAGEGVSFADLVEIVAIGSFKQHGFTVPTIRRIVANCQQQFGERYPLSTQMFKSDGRDVFVSRESGLHDVLRSKGQLAWDEVLAPFLATLDYRESFAHRWWPLGRLRPVVVDPEYGFGLPVIAETGVRTETVRERFEVGDSIDQISFDFNLTAIQVESAIQFELQRAA
jgi:uncharacterized protein (DUF433 family)